MKRMTSKKVAKRHLLNIEKTRIQIRKLVGRIYLSRYVLNEIIIEAYNRLSEPIDGVTITEARFGSNPCSKSPVGVCAYCTRREEAMSIPGQREYAAEKAAGKAYRVLDTPSTMLDACLFCGTRGYEEDGEEFVA